MTNIEYHYQTIGRILAHVVGQGLARVNLSSGDALEIMTERRGDEEDVISAFEDCLLWMRDEGLIRVADYSPFLGGGYDFNGIQLTSAGIALIRADTGVKEIGGSIEKKVAETKGNMDTSLYTRIGEFVGSALGGLTKSLAGG